MRWDVILGIARAESRLTRRLVRYWVFLALAFFAFMVWPGSFIGITVLHGLFSSLSGTAGALNPRFLLTALGFSYVVILVAGLIFVAFDIRARDQRERIVEVLDSRPCTNLELVLGRYLGILFQIWWPAILTIALVQLFGWVAQALDWPVGEPAALPSILVFVVLMTIPAFTFALGLVFLVSLLVRNRLVTALAVLAVLVVWAVLLFVWVPMDLVGYYDLTGTYTMNLGTEMLSIFTWDGFAQRVAVFLAGLGMLVLAAAVHPRPEGPQRRTWAIAGTALLVVAAAGVGFLVQRVFEARALHEQWKAAHEARVGESEPDIESIRGRLTITPAQRLDLELEIDFEAPEETALERALLSFNPGLAVERLTDGSGQALEFSHRDGLLDVALARPLGAGQSATLRLAASGAPDTRFAYLDVYKTLGELDLMNGNLAILGYQPAVLDRHFAALMPAVRWLPAAGADVGRDDPGRPADFFELDLTVDVPEGWLVAGPARRRGADGAAAGRARYRFEPTAPLPEVALIAGRFERRATELAGIELELLLHPEHTRNLEVLADAGDEIRSWLEERFEEAAEIGLSYPYDSLTLVEVPNTLQGYGGGWRMDTVMAPPALLLVRESGFPTARFSTPFRDPEDFEDHEGGMARAKREALERFFENDFSGGNVFLGAARNFFLYQTASHGKGALALDFVCHDLANRLVTGKQGYFSAHLFKSGNEMQQVMGNVFTDLGSRGGEGTFNDAFEDFVTGQPQIWDQVLGVSLADIDPWEDPSRTINVLVLKGRAMSRSMIDGMGRSEAARLLAALRERSAGRTFDRDDLRSVASELGIDLGGLVGDWLEATDLPGFLVSEPKLYRLGDTADGVPRYQLALRLRNDESAPGLVRLRYRFDGTESGAGNGGRRWDESDPIRVGGHEALDVGLVLSKPPRELHVAPYLALNRDEFAVPLPTLDQEKIVEAEPFAGIRPVEWQAAETGAIVVDDLDDGFSVEQDEHGAGLRLGTKTREGALDQGLPAAGSLQLFQLPEDWSRKTMTDAWGKYRRTVAFIKKGKGHKRAVFTAEVDRSGPWRLELHMLPSSAFRGKAGTYHLTVEDSSGSHELTFDAGAAEEGWNQLGELEIASGEVRVSLSDETDGRAVVADAIRWRPARSNQIVENTDG